VERRTYLNVEEMERQKEWEKKREEMKVGRKKRGDGRDMGYEKKGLEE